MKNGQAIGLVDRMSGIIADIVEGAIKCRVCQWRNNNIDTLKELEIYIEEDCGCANLEEKLSKNQEYKEAIAIIFLSSVVEVIIDVIPEISTGIAKVCLDIFLAVPMLKLGLLSVVGDANLVRRLYGGDEGDKKKVLDKLQSISMPQMFRNRITDEKIAVMLKEINLKSKLRECVIDNR